MSLPRSLYGTINYHLSCTIALTIKAEPYRCWRNAVLATLVVLPLFDDQPHYHEGWIVVPRKATIEIQEHGWCSHRGGQIIDPSIILVVPDSQPIAYFPGYTLPRNALEQCLPGSTLPLVCHSRYGRDGKGHAGYKAAFEQAMQDAQALASEKQLPPAAIHILGRERQVHRTLVEY